jgi:hypothetical protein
MATHPNARSPAPNTAKDIAKVTYVFMKRIPKAGFRTLADTLWSSAARPLYFHATLY